MTFHGAGNTFGYRIPETIFPNADAAALTHVVFNWNALLKHIATRTSEYFRFWKEMLIAVGHEETKR